MHGRDTERALLGGLLGRVRGGRAEALVLRGEPGIGKTALLDDLAGAADDVSILRVTGVETEAGLPYAALHQLLHPAHERLGGVPEGPREALRSALGLGEPARADRFLVGLGVLGVLSGLSADGPVLSLVDDAQWIDRESSDALLFAVRRLHAEPVGAVFAARDDGGAFPAPGLPELVLSGLSRTAAETLLGDGLDLSVRDRLIEEARGNPLALIELPRALTAEQRAGALPPLSMAFDEGLPGKVSRGFRERIAALPALARTCLLLAALDGDRDAVFTAASALGAGITDFAIAERAGLLRVGSAGVEPRHPLVRVAAQAAADIAERTAAHLALADASDADRRTWHLASAATGPDETLAARLDAIADRALAIGALSLASTAAERAADLSAEAGARTGRLTYAATAALEAGRLDRADRLARRASRGTADADSARRLAGGRALIEYERGLPRVAAAILVDEAAPLTTGPHLPSVLARAAVYTWHCGHGPEQAGLFDRIGERVTGLPGSPLTGLVEGLRLTSAGNVAAAVPALAAYVSTMDDPAVPFPQRLSAAHVSLAIGDHHRSHAIAAALVADCHADGRITLLPQPLGLLAVAQTFLGEHRDAFATLHEAQLLAQDTGQRHRLGHLAGLRSWLHALSGDEEATRTLAEEAVASSAGGERVANLAWAVQGLTALDVGRGRFEDVLERLESEASGPARHSLTVQVYTAADHVEAAVRCGRSERATVPLERFGAWAGASGQPWARGVALRSAALVAGGDEGLYTRALAEHALSPQQPLEHARTLLVYGEWLRRRQRRADAAVRLAAALDVFERIGARDWAARTETELRAAGVHARGPVRDDPLSALTPQELQVVRLAATGASNRDIATRLFLSPRTVGYHLYKAFPKLGVSSRAELAAFAVPKRTRPAT